MNYLNCCCLVVALSSFLLVVISASAITSQELKDATLTDEDQVSTNPDSLSMLSKRAQWKNLNAAWGKRAWADMQKAWGKRRGWDRLSAAWGKRMAPSDLVNEPSTESEEAFYGMDKRPAEWSSLKGSWGKRAGGHTAGWSNLKGSWGKRANWNKLNAAWGKRSVDNDDEIAN